MKKTYNYPVYYKNGTIGENRVTREIKKIPRTPEEIASMQNMYDAGIVVKYIIKHHKISLYNFHKHVNVKTPPAHPCILT